MTKIEPPIEHVKSYDPFKGLPLDDMFNAGIQVYGITMGDLETIATLVATQDNNYIWLCEDPRLKESHMLDIEGLREHCRHS